VLDGGPTHYTAQGEFDAKGQKTFNFVADVVANRQGFAIQADPIEFSIGSESWRGLIQDLVVVNEHSVALGLLRLASRAQRLEASGTLRVHGEHQLQAQLQNFDLAAVRALLGSERFALSHGYADASLELRGNSDRPVISVQGAIRQAVWPGLDMADVLYTVDYQNGRLEFDTEAELNSRGTLHLAGQGELDAAIADPREALRSGLYNLALTATAVDLRLFPALRGVIDSGLLSGSLEAQGGLDAITLSGGLTASRMVLHGWAPVEFSSQFQYNHDTLSATLQVKDKVADWLTADLSWSIGWHRLQDPLMAARDLLANDFSLRGQTFDRALDALAFALPIGAHWPLRLASTFTLARELGQLRGTLDTQLKAEQPLVDESCQLSAGSALRTSWQLSNDHADLTFEGQLDGRTVASGQGAMDWPFDAYARGLPVSQPPVAAWSGRADIDRIERVPVLCQHGAGELHARWDSQALFSDSPSASFEANAAITPMLRVPSGSHYQVVSACESDPLRVELSAHTQAKQITWQAQSHGCLAGGSTLHGSTPVLWDEAHKLPTLDDTRLHAIELELHNAQLKPLLNYTPGVLGFSAIGTGQIKARAQHGRVSYQGQLSVSEGQLYAVGMGRELRDIGWTWVASGNWMKLDHVHAAAGRGAIDAAGGLGFDGWLPHRLQLALLLKDFPVEREGMELAALTGNAALIGELEPARARVAVKLHALSIRLPDASSRALQTLEPNPDISLGNAGTRLRKATTPYVVEFAVEGSRAISARRNDFEASLATQLAIEYRDPELRVGGFVEFRRGNFEVFGKRFEINRGGMRFDASAALDPEVNLVAIHQPDTAGAAPVFVNVSGTLSEPTVEFYSDQCPEAAVVLLVSGRCPTETSSSGYSDASGTQDAFAAGIIGGILTLGARRELGGLIPRLAVESSARGTRTRVKAGFEAVPKFMRSLVQRVYVQGALSTADNTATDTSAQASVTTPDFLLELYFPNSIVGAARAAPTVRSWGLDITWEP
jgi:hypothetical protein